MDIHIIKKNISDILDTFGREEMGNRLTQFAMASLKGFIIQEFDKAEAQEKSPNSGT